MRRRIAFRKIFSILKLQTIAKYQKKINFVQNLDHLTD